MTAMGILASLFFGFIPMFLFAGFVYWLDRFEKEPKHLLGAAFLWGAVIASAGAFVINTIFGISVYNLTGSETAADLATTTLMAPVVEEILKAVAVVLVFLLFRREFDSILDGIVYAGVTALGFAATENAYYIYSYGYVENGWPGLFALVFVRVILVGWQHPFYTAFTGIGLAITRLNQSPALKVAAPLVGLALSITTHALHNLMAGLFDGMGALIGFFFDWSGWLAMFIFILVMINREKRWMIEYLREEVELGTLSHNQYRCAANLLQRVSALLSVHSRDQARRTRRFYQLLAELAHKKRQYARMGDEGGNARIIAALRAEITTLATDATPVPNTGRTAGSSI
jgi:RsiW-degrading membrane proteinase PrsW (M82 family)